MSVSRIPQRIFALAAACLMSASCGSIANLKWVPLASPERITARAWTPRLVPQIAAFKGDLNCGALSSDGTKAAVGDTSGLILLFDLGSGTLAGRVALHDRAVLALSFTPDGATLWSAGANGEICATDVRTASPKHCWRFPKPEHDLDTMYFSRDATLVAGYGVWRTADGARQALDESTGLELFHGTVCDSRMDSPACEVLQSLESEEQPPDRAATQPGQVVRFDLRRLAQVPDPTPAQSTERNPTQFQSRDRLQQLAPMATPGHALLRRPGGRLLALTAFGGEWRELGHADVVAVSADGRHAIAFERGDSTLGWTRYSDDAGNGPTPTGQSTTIALGDRPLAAASGRLAFVASGGRLWAFDTRTGSVATLRQLNGAPLNMSPHGELLITEHEGAYAPLDVWSDRPLPQFTGDRFAEPSFISSACARSGCRTLTEGGVLRDAVTSNTQRFLEPPPNTLGVSLGDSQYYGSVLSGDSRRVARLIQPWDLDPFLQIMNATNGSEIGRIAVPCGIYTQALNQDGSLLLVSDEVCAHRGSLTSGLWIDILSSAFAVRSSIDTVNRLRLYAVDTGDELFALERPPAAAMTFSPRTARAYVGYTGRESVIDVLDLEDGEVVEKLRGHTDDVSGLALSEDGKLLVSTSFDGTTRLWNTRTRESVTLVFSGSEWIAYTESGDFDASRRGDRLAAAFVGGEALPLDQLALRSNRPDRVLASFDSAEREVLDYFAFMRDRRLKQIGLSETQLAKPYSAAPRVAIVDVRRDGRSAELTLEFTASDGELASYNVYDNGVPLLGVGGEELAGRRGARPQIKLVNGTNRLEVSVRTTTGLESTRVATTIDVKEPTTRRIFYLGLGVSHYQNPAMQGSPSAHGDAVALGELLLQAGAKVLVPCEDQVTIDGIDSARAFFAKATVDDIAVILVAGHGTRLPGRGRDYVYLTYEADTGALEDTAARLKLFEGLLASIAPRQKLLLLDTCEAGDETSLPPATVERSAIDTIIQAGPRDRFIYTDIGLQTGSVVFAAARGYERSQGGCFTKELIAALSEEHPSSQPTSSIGLDQLYDRVARGVTRCNPGQHPTIVRENRATEIVLPLVKNLRRSRREEVDRCKR